MSAVDKLLAVITGATSGIGLELAKLVAGDGYALLLAADRPFERALAELSGAAVETITADLSTTKGVAALVAQVGEREVDVLCANAGHGLSQGFLDQDLVDVCKLIGINVVGTLDLVQQIRRPMRARGKGRILLTGSLAGLLPGAYQAAYNASTAFVDNLASPFATS